MYGADGFSTVQYRSGICRQHLGKRAGPSRSIYRAVTGGHTVAQAGAWGFVDTFPAVQYKRSRRRHAQVGPYKRSHRRQAQASAWGRVDPFTVQSRGVMPVGLEHRDRVGLFTTAHERGRQVFAIGARSGKGFECVTGAFQDPDRAYNALLDLLDC
ncbi:hypothetical protein Bbelb_386150 [Branchiostoma belcheri]|nr:hypothetical protein Bbelb_386150 [Branchiostoma belcheri]